MWVAGKKTVIYSSVKRFKDDDEDCRNNNEIKRLSVTLTNVDIFYY